jgi:hypothetical protein
MLIAAFLAVSICWGGQAWAWAYQGHEIVGSIADKLLRDHARREVAGILGISLQTAAPWADCVKSVRVDGSGFKYDPAKLEYRIPCAPFENDSETARMEDFVARNWRNCIVNGRAENCHGSYHYTDISIQRDHYDSAYEGASEHDIVGAINAAIHVLRDEPVPPPFSLRDKKEALLLLAHLLGDLHQPLHVGAVYLDAGGTPIDPDVHGPGPAAIETAGGNNLIDGQTTLHIEWDATPLKLGTAADAEMLDRARAVPDTPGPIGDFAAAWASETLVASHAAFAGLTFQGIQPFNPDKPRWSVHFGDAAAACQNDAALKQAQLAKAGARLAQLLNAIWR